MNADRDEAAELDAAYGNAPLDAATATRRAEVLDRLAVAEHGMTFRYVPAGTFQMGSDAGDPDERPVHPVALPGFWLSETTISWDLFNTLMGWDENGYPPEGERETTDRMVRFHLREAHKIRLQYCEDKTDRAGDWHSHDPNGVIRGRSGAVPATALFGAPRREDDTAYRYSRKPMVAVAWQEAEELCERISTPSVLYRLPTEAEWERAARGGLLGCRYAWGNEPPTAASCDFNRFDDFSIRPFRNLPPNGYGLYAMCGSVWEWTRDLYDALAYANVPDLDDPPSQPMHGAGRVGREADIPERVLRGGSWADSAEAVTVSFRMSRGSSSWRVGGWAASLAPNIGFRIARIERRVPGSKERSGAK